MTTRGERNNNPLNIDRTQIHWEGMAANQTDPRFIVNTSAVYCYRDAARIIREHFHERKTIADIIVSWAPGAENDSDAYVYDVWVHMGISPDVPLNITRVVGDPCDLLPLLAAMTYHENGEDIYEATVIQQGMDLEITA
jgi:hypothetical protein